MKQISRVIAPLFLAIPLFISCSKDYQAPESSEEQTESKVTIDLAAELENLEDLQAISSETGETISNSEARVFFEDQGVGNGINFGYTVGEKLQAVLFFKRGTQTDTQEVTLTVEKNTNGATRYKVKRHKITLPNKIARASGDLYISGAIGVIRKGSSSRVQIPSPGHLINAQGNYTVPMYFPLTRLEVKPESLLKTSFKVYGALVGFTAKNKHNTKYLLKELDIKSRVFDTEGDMDLNTENKPQWYATQNAGATKTIELISPNSTVAANSAKTFFFWVKPTAENITAQNNQIEIGLKSFTTTDKPLGYDGGLPGAQFRIPVKKALQDNLVHRIPELAIPLPGELIITEVFRGGDAITTAIEVYNSSDVPVNLANYQMRSYNPQTGQTYTSELVQPNVHHFRKFVEPRTNFAAVTILDALKLSPTDIARGYYTLQPKEMAVFVAGKIVINTSMLRTRRNNLRWVFNFLDHESVKGLHLYSRGGYLELVRKATRLGQRPQVIDVFLKMNGQGGTQNHDAWSYTMMRKPDRNTPRQTMLQGSNSDWIARDRNENMDWGYRFGFEYGPVADPLSANNMWFDGVNNRWNGNLEVGNNGRPLTYLNTDPTHAGFLRSWEQKETRQLYTVPMWWTRDNGTAH